jgi:hypothetical protein
MWWPMRVISVSYARNETVLSIDPGLVTGWTQVSVRFNSCSISKPGPGTANAKLSETNGSNWVIPTQV